MEFSFSLQHLVKLFRKLKLIKNYHFFLYIPENSGLYYLIVTNADKTRVVQVLQHDWLVLVNNYTGHEQLLYLDSSLINVITSMSVSESMNTEVTVYKAVSDNGTEESLIARVVDEIISSQAPVEQDIALILKAATALAGQVLDSSGSIPLKEFTTAIQTISQTPYDITKLLVRGGHVYFTNPDVTRLIRLPINAELSSIDIVNPFEMYALLSGKFIYDIEYHALTNSIKYMYGMSKTDNNLSEGLFFLQTEVPTVIDDLSTVFDTFTPSHKTVASKGYLSSLKAIADKEGLETIPFLTFDRDTKLYTRDLSWLLSFKRDVDISYQSHLSMCRIDTLTSVQALFTLYSQQETITDAVSP